MSRLCAEIDERVRGLLAKPVEGHWPYLWLDATYMKVCEACCIVPVAVTIAVGVNAARRREVLGMAVGSSEAEPFWLKVLRTLRRHVDPRPSANSGNVSRPQESSLRRPSSPPHESSS